MSRAFLCLLSMLQFTQDSFQGLHIHRNFEVAKALLGAVQEHADVVGVDNFHLANLAHESGVSQDDWMYARALLIDSGYLIAESGKVRMTWAGHDLLDKLKSK